MVHWGDVPTWVAAGIAFLAFVAAFLAYRAQSDTARKQAQQVDLQRRQLDLQAQVIADQTGILERRQADQVDVQEFGINGELAGVTSTYQPVNVAVVFNGSKRPVRNVICRIEADSVQGGAKAEKLASTIMDMRITPPQAGRPMQIEDTPRKSEDRSDVVLLRAGVAAGFAFPFSIAEYPEPLYTTRFTDDAGLHWQIDPYLHLEKLPSRDYW
jgi:hypothetical protein